MASAKCAAEWRACSGGGSSVAKARSVSPMRSEKLSSSMARKSSSLLLKFA